RGRELTRTSYIDGVLPSGWTPRWVVAWACGSRSSRQTRRPAWASAAARLTAVVVLPTPPFWLRIAIRRIVGSFRHAGLRRDYTSSFFSPDTPNADARSGVEWEGEAG